VAASKPLSRLESALQRLARDLAALRRPWALVGGLAVSARTRPRFTRDIDLAVLVTGDADAEALLRDLAARGYRVHALVEQEAVGRLATARLLPAGESEDGIVVDALFASSGLEPEVVADADVLEVLPGLRVPVATVGHLIALKLLARDDDTRPMDRADLLALVATAGPQDIAQARAAIVTIQQRGFHRQKDLPAELARLLGQSEANPA
jgi:predicted nucleotidyltransferase